jgi:hypothetical protein
LVAAGITAMRTVVGQAVKKDSRCLTTVLTTQSAGRTVILLRNGLKLITVADAVQGNSFWNNN